MNWDDVRIKKREHLQLVGEYIQDVIKDIASDQKMEELATIQSYWPEIAGDKISRVATPSHYQNGTLTLKVKSAVWRQELHGYSSALITTIREKLPEILVENIIFR